MRRHPEDRPRLGDRLRLAAAAAATVVTRAHTRASDRMTLVLPAVPAGTQILLGRSRANDVRFLEPSVSRRHAALQRVAGGWLVVDLGSTHGTFVNGRRATARSFATATR